NIIFGNVIDDALGDEVRVTVIAAGFDDPGTKAPAPLAPARRAAAPATLPSAPSAPEPPVAASPEPARREQPAEPVPAYAGSEGERRGLEVPRVFDEEPVRSRREEDLDIPDFLR